MTVGAPGDALIGASRGTDIPSEALADVRRRAARDCPAVRGDRLVGSPQGDRIKGTAGDDSIRSRGGDDKIDVRQGGADASTAARARDKVQDQAQRDADAASSIKGSCERVKQK